MLQYFVIIKLIIKTLKCKTFKQKYKKKKMTSLIKNKLENRST